MFVRRVSNLDSFVGQKEKCFAFVREESQGKRALKNYSSGLLILLGEPNAAGRAKDNALVRVF